GGPSSPAGRPRTRLTGAAYPELAVPGLWRPVAVDGKSVLLQAVTAAGRPTGSIALRGLDGSVQSAPEIGPSPARTGSFALVDGGNAAVRPGRGRGLPSAGAAWAVVGPGPVGAGHGQVLYPGSANLFVRNFNGLGPSRALSVKTGFYLPGGLGLVLEQGGSFYLMPWSGF